MCKNHIYRTRGPLMRNGADVTKVFDPRCLLCIGAEPRTVLMSRCLPSIYTGRMPMNGAECRNRERGPRTLFEVRVLLPSFSAARP
jgi:hypothetical protein